MPDDPKKVEQENEATTPQEEATVNTDSEETSTADQQLSDFFSSKADDPLDADDPDSGIPDEEHESEDDDSGTTEEAQGDDEPKPAPKEVKQPEPTQEKPTEPKVPEQKPETPVEPPKEPTAEQPVQPQESAADRDKRAKENRELAENLLATQHYVLPEELVEEIQTSPETAVPKMMAKVYLDAVANSLSHMVNMLPSLIQTTQQQTTIAQQAEEKFFATWPQLREHSDTVMKFAHAYRHVYPTAGLDEFIQNVGAQAMIALKMQPGEQPPPQQPQQQPQPFQPAASAKPRSNAPTAEPNIWTEMALEEEPLDID